MRTARYLAAMALLSACSPAPERDARIVSEWMHTMYGVMRAERLSPPVASRVLTYSTSALYSGLAVDHAGLRPLSGVLNGFPELPTAERSRDVDGAIVAVAANRVVLDSLLREALPTTRSALRRLADSLENARVAAGVTDDIRARSVDLGGRMGLAIVAWSRTDGFDQTRGRAYAGPVGPAYWVNDAPASVFASQNMSGASEFLEFDNPANVLQAGKASDRGLVLNRPKAAGGTIPAVNIAGTSEPYWGEVRPFALTAWNECTIPAPPAYSTDTTSELYKHAFEVYSVKQKLTPEDRTTALYWADNPGESGTPVGHWIGIASQMVSQHKLSAADAARLMVLTSAAQADAFVASWGYKYAFSYIRPRTYIRRVIDSTWEPLIPTPPFPEYPSGHSTQSAAAAEAITSLLGVRAFDDSSSKIIGHDVRRFESFAHAAEEAGMSRIYGGIHFPFGNTAGRALGQCIGAKVVGRYNNAD